MNVSTRGARHATGAELDREMQTGGPLSDASAAAIASWYQSPTGHGLTFARLAQGDRVHRPALLDAITAELTDPANYPAVTAELHALAAWARAVR